MSLDELLPYLEHGDTRHVRASLIALDEGDRKALAPKARNWLASVLRPVPVAHAALAVLATAKGHRQAAAAVHAFGLDQSFVDHAVAVLQARAPDWLPEFVTTLLDDDRDLSWRVVRGLVRTGAAPEPDHPGYFRGMVSGVPDHTGRQPLVELVHEHGLTADHLCRMLATERAGRRLAYFDDFRADNSWRDTLVALTRQGHLDRGRLLDTVLAAPLRDWAAADLGWYVGLHDALEPTLYEVADRQSTYARLLAVEHGPSVKAAQHELGRLIPDPRFDPHTFLDAGRATLARTDKSTVVAQLRLLEQLAATRPEVDVTDAARTAVDHPRADVRERAATLLARFGAAEPEATQAPAIQGVAQTAPFTPPSPQPRPVAPPVQAVEHQDELAELLFELLEQSDALDLERAIDGVLRFAGRRPAIADLLAQRASAVLYVQDDPRDAARALALAWLCGTVVPTGSARRQTHVGAIGRRVTGVARAVRDGAESLLALPIPLALPTRADFSLDAAELDRRLHDLRLHDRQLHDRQMHGTEQLHPSLELELAVALLRVPPADRAAVTVPDQLRGSPAIARILVGDPPRWVRELADVREYEWKPFLRFPLFRDESGSEDHVAAGLLPRATPADTVLEESDYGIYSPHFEQLLALGAALLPHDHDVVAAHAHPYLTGDLTAARACSVAAIDAIARAGSTTGPPASSALVLALAAKDAHGRTAAHDAVLDLARYGLLDGAELGRQAALLLTENIVVGGRVSSGLAECARAGDAAVLPVLDALQEIAEVLPGRRDAGGFLELAADLAERTGRTVTLPAAFHELAAGRSSSALAKAVRRLLPA